MSAALLNFRAGREEVRAGEWGHGQPLLNVVLLYDDGEIGRQARALVDRVSPPGPPGTCVIQSCPFQELIAPPAFETAPSQSPVTASEADLLVVAVAGPGDLPVGVKVWLRQWLSRRDPRRRGALVALFKNRGPESVGSLARIHLETVASLAGLDFFPGQIAEVDHSVTWLQPAGTWDEAVPDVAWTYDEALNDAPAVHHWGLND